jgi:hypothetical protein
LTCCPTSQAATTANTRNGFVHDLDGNHVTDSFGNDGFPSSFDPSPSQGLGYVAQMLEAGVQVVYFYIEDAHDNHVSSTQFTNCPSNPDGAFGPGEAAYVCQLQAYDAAFQQVLCEAAEGRHHSLRYAVHYQCR